MPGLHVETFCYEAIAGPADHPEAVAAALAAGARLLTFSLCEPTGVDRISDRLDAWTKSSACQALSHLATRAADALNKVDQHDEEIASEIWASLFGNDCFPRPSADEKSFLARLWTGTAVASAPAVFAAHANYACLATLMEDAAARGSFQYFYASQLLALTGSVASYSETA